MSKSQVYLFIYDQTKTLVRISGQQKSYHAGISLYGKEYCYTEEGITANEHKNNFNGAPLKRTFTLGMTDISETSFLDKISRLKCSEFGMSNYDMKMHNSCHFARQLIKFLLEVDKLEPELEEFLHQAVPESHSSGCILT